MTNEFLNKPTKIQPAIVGTIANADDYNNNIAGQSKGSIVPIDENGNYKDGDLGNEAIVAKGALINNIKMRQGGFIKIYDVDGNFLNNVSFGDATETTKGFSFLNKRILTKNNVSTPATDIDFSAGNFIFDDGSGVATFSAVTGSLAANFGSGIGMLDTGTKANSTWYHLFAIYNPTSNLAKPLASLSATSPTLPGGYTKKRRIGAVRTDSSGNILLYFQFDNRFYFSSQIEDRALAAPSSSPTLLTVTLPLGISTIGMFNAYLEAGSILPNQILLAHPSANTAASSTNYNLRAVSSSASVSAINYVEVATNTNSQISIDAVNTNGSLQIMTQGWIDYQL